MGSRLLLLLFVAVALAFPRPAFATPPPPVILVNHTTRQCAQARLASPCYWCTPPEEWQVLGFAYDHRNQCPAGYEDLGYTSLHVTCTAFNNPWCCSWYGNGGDCEDLVVSKAQKLCAFVDEINGCTLPEGWRRQVDGRCPVDYRWLPDIACVAAIETPEPMPALPPTDTATPTVSPLPPATDTLVPTLTPQPTDTPEPKATQLPPATDTPGSIAPGLARSAPVPAPLPTSTPASSTGGHPFPVAAVVLLAATGAALLGTLTWRVLWRRRSG